MVRASKPGVFLETSTLVRFLVADDPVKAEIVRQLLEKVDTGDVRPYLSSTVFMELAYVLTRVYKQTPTHAQSRLAGLLQMRSLTLIEQTDTRMALELWKQTRLPYGDCLIATQVPHGVQLATFDKDFTKFERLKLFDWESV